MAMKYLKRKMIGSFDGVMEERKMEASTVHSLREIEKLKRLCDSGLCGKISGGGTQEVAMMATREGQILALQ
jgi:hypothetical protein